MRKQISLALGGGGARGLSHLGAISALEEHGIPIDRVVGTSIGSISGALYAIHGAARPAIEAAKEYLRSARFRRNSLHQAMAMSREQGYGLVSSIASTLRKHLAYQMIINRRSLFKPERLYELLSGIIDPAFRIEDTRIPMAVTAVNLLEGREVLIRSGSLLDAMMASSSLPGIFPPVAAGNMLLADYGVVNSVPVEAARAFGGDVVIAIDTTSGLPRYETGELDSGLDQMLRVAQIASRIIDDLAIRSADYVIHPEVGSIFWADFTLSDELMLKGRVAALKALPTLIRDLAPVPVAWHRPAPGI